MHQASLPAARSKATPPGSNHDEGAGSEVLTGANLLPLLTQPQSEPWAWGLAGSGPLATEIWLCAASLSAHVKFVHCEGVKDHGSAM